MVKGHDRAFRAPALMFWVRQSRLQPFRSSGQYRSSPKPCAAITQFVQSPQLIELAYSFGNRHDVSKHRERRQRP